MIDLNGKTILITGGASGIGLGITEYCIKAQAKVIVLDVNESSINKLSSSVGASTNNLDSYQIDVSSSDAITNLFNRLYKLYPYIDILINCAGVSGPFGPIWEIPDEQFRWTLEVNLFGIYHVLSNFLKRYRQNSDNEIHIVNVSSHLGLLTHPHLSAYQSSKHAIVALSEALQYDLKEEKLDHIFVHVFFPFFVKSNLCQSDRHLKDQLLFISKNAKAFYNEIENATLEGIDPIDAAEILFDSIFKKEFYIFTNKQTQVEFKNRANKIIGES